LHPEGAVARTLPPDTQFAALLRRLDDLLDEATRLRVQIDHAMKGKQSSPFWPDRRREPKPVSRERRR
jgi:hypothetical protein